MDEQSENVRRPVQELSELALEGDDAEPQTLVERFDQAHAPVIQVEEEEGVLPEDVTVVIPTLDEAEAIGKVLDEVKDAGFRKILVIDGNSVDDTVAIAKSKGVTVLQQHGAGKAGAISTSLSRVRTPYVVVMDGDYTYRAADIYKLLEHAQNYDEVIGARTSGRENIPMFNRLGNWLISKLFKLLFNKPITDVLSGMYLLRTETAKEVEITSTSFDIEVEMACAIASVGNMTQVPIDYGKRIGKQKLSPGHGSRIISTLIWMANNYNPVFLYGMIVTLSVVPAAAILLWTLYERFVFNVWHSGYALFGVMLLLLASQAGAVSAMSLMSRRSEQRLVQRLRKLQVQQSST